jgi:hypothetical protein
MRLLGAMNGSSTVAFASGSMILIDLAMARLLLSADQTYAYFLGKPILWECRFKKAFGVPCPTCGLTRSVVLTLHGSIFSAWDIAPGGPALTLGMIAFSGLLIFHALRARHPENKPVRFPRKAVYLGGAVVVLVWLGGWAAALIKPV